jgi:hypothetical protein
MIAIASPIRRRGPFAFRTGGPPRVSDQRELNFGPIAAALP